MKYNSGYNLTRVRWLIFKCLLEEKREENKLSKHCAIQIQIGRRETKDRTVNDVWFEQKSQLAISNKSVYLE